MSLTSQEKLRKSDLASALHITWGNSWDRLFDALATDLFAPGGSPFARRLIVVPDYHVKEFIMRSCALSPHWGIAAGLHIVPLHQAIGDLVDLSTLFLPSFLELSLAIEASFASIESAELEQYLGERDVPSRSRRLPFLARELARVFIDYGLYAGDSLSSWLLQKGWQQDVWRQVFGSGWTYPQALLGREDVSQTHYHPISLFGFSYVEPVLIRWFAALEARFYLFSPCSLFWEDVFSDKERLSLARSWEKHPEAYPDLTSDHPLLGNLGKLGRALLKTLGNFPLVESETYVYSEPISLLGCIQKSILHLEPLELYIDDSIQIHTAPSKLREVEILKDAMQTFLAKMSLAEICVVAPDIALYAPYIEMVFASSQIPYVIEQPAERRLSLFSLLELPQERYSLKSVSQLLKEGEWREPWSFSWEEVGLLCRYFEKAQIVEDLTGHMHSWEEGLDRLLMGLVLDEEGAVPCIPFSEIDLLNRFLELFSRIQSDLSTLLQARTLAEWVLFLSHLVSTYFIENSQEQPLCRALHALRQSCRAQESYLFPFETIYRALHSLDPRRTEAADGSALICASLGARSIIQPRVLWCLGLDEKSFPRGNKTSSLCQIEQVLRVKPTQGNIDRFAFLDLLTQTREHLIFSYERADPQDHTPQQASLLIEELKEYVEVQSRGGSIQTTHHPSFPLDARYFCSESLVKKGDLEEWSAARAFYAHQKIPPRSFLSPSSPSSVGKGAPLMKIRQLKVCARSPLELYFNETLRFSLSRNEDAETQQFLLPAFKRSELRKGSELEASLRKARARGELPVGIFGALAASDLVKEKQKHLLYLEQWGLSEVGVRTFCLCKKSHQDKRPAIFCEGIPLVGDLEGVTSQGLLFYGDLSFPSLLRIWPLYLLYLQLESTVPVLLSMKEGLKLSLPVQRDPKQLLDAYVRYVLAVKQRPCFVTSEMIRSVLKNEPCSSQKEVEDPYWEYIKHRQAIPSPEEERNVWAPWIQEAFECALIS